ncbi:MAG: isocitrate lyase/PEP mutase family protein [Rhodospirillales bacterium]|jgi:2-methylisocitrate lyase-like PEP mutase family enzyme
MKATTKLKKLVNTPGVSLSVSAHDALLARLVENAGFEIIGVSGNTVAASYLGMPDMGFLNLSDMVNVCGRIASAVSIPVLVDVDSGYGNAMQVVRTVKELERAGVAGVIIEDQIDYKKCGMIDAEHPVIDIDEYASKIRAACMARTDPDFVICARTDATRDHGIEEAIKRARVSHDAGADMIDIACQGTRDQVDQLKAANLPIPLKGNMDEGKKLWENDNDVLADAGFSVLSHPGLLRYIVVGAAMRSLEHLKREGNTRDIHDQMCTVKEYFDAVDLNGYLEMEKKVL